MEALIQAIASFLRGLKVFHIVPPDEEGVRTTGGRIDRRLEPGVHPVWPIIGAVYTLPSVEQQLDLRMQSLTTADGRSVGVSFLVNYRVIDVIKAMYRAENVNDRLEHVVMAVAARAVGDRDWLSLTDEIDELENEVRQGVDHRMTWYGLEITDTHLNDFTLQRVVRLVQNREAYGAAAEE